MSAAANKKLVQQIYADSASRSGTTFADNLAEDAVWVVTGQYSWSHEFKGRDAIQNGLMGHFRSFFAVRPRTVAFNFIAEGDYVVVEAQGDNVTKAGACATTIIIAWCGGSRTARSRRSRNIATPRWSNACSGRFRRSASLRLMVDGVCAGSGIAASKRARVRRMPDRSYVALIRVWRERAMSGVNSPS